MEQPINNNPTNPTNYNSHHLPPDLSVPQTHSPSNSPFSVGTESLSSAPVITRETMQSPVPPPPPDLPQSLQPQQPQQPQQTKANKRRIGAQKVGSVTLKEIDHLALAFNMTRRKAIILCKDLRVPLLYIGSSILFNETALTRILYYLTKVGGPGYAAPGSTYKDKQLPRRKAQKAHGRPTVQPQAQEPITKITDDILENASSAATLAEMNIENARQRPTMAQLSKLMGIISEGNSTSA